MSASLLDSCSFTYQFKLNFSETENVAIGHSVCSEAISAGGHLWRIFCYPRGDIKEIDGEYLTIFLEHECESESIKAIFEAAVMEEDGTLSSSHKERLVEVFAPKGSTNSSWGLDRLVERSVLKSLYVTNGSFIIMCGAKVVLDEDPLEVPPSDIGSHLGHLLDCTDGSDVSFVVNGEMFPAHRAVLAARSPVFKAQLLGSMADAKMPTITLHDIAPATFKVMLRFMYTDACPEESELGDYPDEMFQHLLSAADRFALDRLKLLCASKLWDNISVDTVAATLICAETYNCPQLKKKCVDSFGEGKDFKTKALLTDGFFWLAQQFPLIVDELRLKVRGSVLDSCSFTHQFKLNFLETEKFAIGHSVRSEVISAGGHLWRIFCYPRGDKKEIDGEYLTIFLEHESKSESVKAIFEAIVMEKDGTQSSSHKDRLVHVFTPKGSTNSSWGWDRFVERSVLKSLYVTNGSFIIMCGAKVVLDEDPIEVLPSDIGSRLGHLLDCTDGSDVSFVVDGEMFPAHRAVLAARSPVFKAQLFGSMADSNMSSITLHDIAPGTFKVMLRFMYTDACPEESELGDYPDEMFQHLLAAADRFALDRLKLLCASKLWDNISEDTVAATLICAETYNCPQLKKKCIDFFGEGKDFKTKALLTEGFFQLGQQFPSIVDELRLKLGA